MKLHLKLTLAVASLLGLSAATTLDAALVYGLSGSNIVSFDTATPAVISATRAITGLNTGDTVVAIDLRPQDGLLYAYSAQNRIYNFTLGVSAVANLVVGPLSNATANGAATAPTSTLLPSGAISIDFNPMANALRIEDTNDGNYRLPFAAFPPASTALVGDGLLRIAAPPDFGQAVDAAYTNNFAGTTSTQLFVIDAVNNALYLQTSPNNGTLAIVGTNLGAGIDIPTSDVGFDIVGATTAYLSGNTNGIVGDEFYTLDLATGTATLVGVIGAPVQDIAIGVVVPEPATIGLMALGAVALVARRRRLS